MNRRQFLKAAAASSLFPGALWGRHVSAAIGEMQYRTLGHTGEKVSIVGVGGDHIGVSSVSEGKVSASSAPRSIMESTSWTTLGATTVDKVRSAWERRFVTDTAKGSF